jgi:hypothetical protein
MAKFVQKIFDVYGVSQFRNQVTFDTSVFLTGATHISSPPASVANTPYALLVESIGSNVVIRYRQLGDMAWETTSTYVTRSLFDSSINSIYTELGYLESSIGDLDELTQIHDNSIGDIYEYQIIQDISIIALQNQTIQSWNGLTTTLDNSVGLGGTLDIPTVITATATNTLSLGGLVTSLDDTPFVLVQETTGGPIRFRELGDMAWETTSTYVTRSLFDSSISSIYTEIGYLESSIGALDILTQQNEDDIIDLYTEIGYLESTIGDLDIVIQSHTTSIAQLDASIVRIDAYNIIQDNSIIALQNQTIQTWNGLSTTLDNSVGLGGTLDIDTNIDTAGYEFSITGGLSIYGTLSVDGSVTYINSVDLNVSDNIITVNYGESGTGVTKGFAGLKVDRGTEDDYVFVFSEATDTFRIGIATESGLPTGTQAVATRQDTPIADAIPFWNVTANRFDTASGFTFISGTGLGLPTATNMGTEATALVWNGTTVGSRELGSMAFETSADYALVTNVNSYNLIQDNSIIQNASDISDVSTNKLNEVANIAVTGNSVFSYETDNVAYLKRMVAGTGTTIIEDTSTITIEVTGAAGYMSKYTGTFDGTADTSIYIPSGTHGLGSGPFIISVFDSNERVYVGEEFNGTGDITLSWTAGSLSASCSYIISG